MFQLCDIRNYDPYCFVVLGICLFFIPYKYEIGFVWLLYFVALYTIGLWIYRFFTRKNIIIKDFEKMAER